LSHMPYAFKYSIIYMFVKDSVIFSVFCASGAGAAPQAATARERGCRSGRLSECGGWSGSGTAEDPAVLFWQDGDAHLISRL
jgi:hypothetical protein